ncbi:TM2 domain-containing protein [Clostridium culturomicium]|uniref:TM2 domain-containing protein n=1 Tax=Clostridium culturomicium TaxID=1499683 RepID=UPI003857D8D0
MNYKKDFIICLFLGWCGGHKFYEKKYGVGALYLFTFGLFFFGWFFDIVRLGIVAFKYSEEDQEAYTLAQIQKAEAKKQQYLDMQQQRKEKAAHDKDHVCCPKCGSSHLTANKKGFSLGKALVGGLVLVPVAGVATGMIGKNKIIITCLNCGKQFKPGQR